MCDNSELQVRREQAIPRGMPNLLPVYVERAKNAEIWDVEGRRYIDFGTGIVVLNTGHFHGSGPFVGASPNDQPAALLRGFVPHKSRRGHLRRRVSG